MAKSTVEQCGGTAIHIDRSTPFNPAEFMGKDWSIWKGPANGDGLSGEEDQDERSLALTTVDLSAVCLETMLLDEDNGHVKGEEKLRRLKAAGHIRLDAKVFLTLWENKSLVPERWKGKYIYFDGTVLRSPGGFRCVLSLYWVDGESYWFCGWLVDDWGVRDPSAVLAE